MLVADGTLHINEIPDMKRIHDTPRTDAVINTFDGNQSKLAADLATHSEELERELTDMKRWKQEAVLVLSKWEAVWVAAGSPGTLGQSKADATREYLGNRVNQAGWNVHLPECLNCGRSTRETPHFWICNNCGQRHSRQNAESIHPETKP